MGIERADLEDIWAKSDFITVHTPLTKETNNLIDDATIAKCKEGVRIVNCARGDLQHLTKFYFISSNFILFHLILSYSV